MQHKCPHCGTEFQGNFCPECGAPRSEGRACPKCGAALSANAKFCNQCGYSFVAASAPSAPRFAQTNPQPSANDKKKGALYTVCRYLPYVLIALLSVLLFVFYLAPVAVIPGGEFLGQVIPAESLGNTYDMMSGEIMPSLEKSAKAIESFSVLLAAISFFVIFILVFGARDSFEDANFFCLLSYLFLLAVFIIACVMMGIILIEGGGLGLVKVGAGPILVVVFSGVFSLLAIVAICIKKHIDRQNTYMSR